MRVRPPPPSELAEGGRGRARRTAADRSAFGRPFPRIGALAAAVLVALLMAVPIAYVGGFGSGIAQSVALTPPNGVGSPSAIHPSAAASHPSSRAPSQPDVGASCAQFQHDWAIRYGSGPAPPAVAGTDPTGCVPGPDEQGVTLFSNRSLSASRYEISVSLPSAAASSPSTLGEFWLSLTVRGVGCSLDGQSVLRIDFAPPGSPLGGSGGWAVRAPVWGLDPAGSCDPRCENTTAYYPIDGQSFCLDNMLLQGVGASNGPVPLFASGDSVRLTITDGGGKGLTVYANDSTRPILSTVWSYAAASMIGGSPVEPFGDLANATSGWTFGGSVAFGWTNCPWVTGSAATACNSYDGAVTAALAFPTVTNASFWNASTVGYADRYSGYDPWSSSGACNGDPNLTACLDFAANGGTGNYPGVAVSAGGGAAWVEFGTNATGTVGPLGPGVALSANGSRSINDPAILTALSASANSTVVIVRVRATDPRGTTNVAFSAVWCFGGGGNTVPSALTISGTRAPGAGNGSEDAYWNATFPRGNNATGGTLFYSVSESFSPTDPGSPRVFGKLNLPSGGLSCGPIASPATLPVRVVTLSEGYRVSWSYPAVAEPFVRNFSLIATPASGPSVIEPIPVSPAPSGVRTADILGLLPGVPYTLYAHSTQVDGRAGPTSPSGLPGSGTYPPLLGNLSAPSLLLWQPTDSETFLASATGGSGPYSFQFEFGNGTTVWSYRQSASVSLSHAFPNYLGVARVELTVNDSVGDVSAPATVLVEVRATPDGVPVVLSTGDGSVGISWASPTSPSAPVSRYVVFYAESADALAVFTSSWPSNGSGTSSVLLWNTSRTQFNFSARDGTPVFVEVIAWNAYGAGLAPSSGPATGVPAPFELVGFAPAPGAAYGGAAPFTASLSAATTQGTNNGLSSAIFTLSELSPVARPLNQVVVAGLANASNGTTTAGWANATFTIGFTGTFLVQVHLEDALLDPALIPSLDLYVGTGVAPTLSIALSSQTPVPFAGSPVDFLARASGTPGPYNFSWAFGDGTSAFDAGSAPSHRYALPGTYTALLTVVDNATLGSASIAQSIQVNAYPVVRISASAGNGALAWTFQAIEFGGSGPAQIAWNFGDGKTGNQQIASHTYANPGEYTVRVTLADPAGIPAVSSNLTIYAGVPRSVESFAQSAAAIGLILILSVGLLLLAVLTVVYYRRAQRAELLAETGLAPTYPKDRTPPPKALAEPTPDRPDDPPD